MARFGDEARLFILFGEEREMERGRGWSGGGAPRVRGDGVCSGLVVVEKHHEPEGPGEPIGFAIIFQASDGFQRLLFET